jgi:hypothetical protein
MSILRRSLITAAWVLLALGMSVSASAQVVVADLNGDGIRDRVEMSPTGTELIVHTSHRHRSQRLRTRDHIVRVVVSDVNRDGRVDIVVTTRRAGLQVWLNAGRGRFRAARPRAPTAEWRRSDGTEEPPSAANDDGADSLGAMLVLAGGTRAPAPDAVFQPFHRSHAIFSSRSTRPRVPRGPPVRSCSLT